MLGSCEIANFLKDGLKEDRKRCLLDLSVSRSQFKGNASLTFNYVHLIMQIKVEVVQYQSFLSIDLNLIQLSESQS